MIFSRLPGKEIKKIGTLVKEEKPQITIITPYYNGGKTLMDTANTIFSQTYPFFEWILIDDGSKDEYSLEKLKELEKMDKRVKVLHKENGGPAAARDFGIKQAATSSRYIYFLDCDDLIENTMLETLYWTLETHKRGSLAYTSMINFGAHKYYWEPYLTLEEELVNNLMCISSMIRKEDLIEVNCFGIKGKAMYEDWNLWLKLLAKGKIPIRTNAPLFWYRTSETGELSRARKNDKKARKLISTTAKTVKEDVEIIQFPKRITDININEDTKVECLPKYKNVENMLFLLEDNKVSLENIKILETIKRLSKDLNVIVVTTTPNNIELRQELKDNCSEFYNLSNFLEVGDYYNFLDYLVKSRNVVKIITNNEYGHAILPKLKEENKVEIIDLVFDRDIIEDNLKIYDALITTKKQHEKNKYNNVLLLETKKVSNKLTKNKNELRKNYNIPENKTVVSFIDNMLIDNNPTLFLYIAKRYEDENVLFLMNGDGQLYKRVKDKVSKLEIEDKVLLLPESEMNPDKAYLLSDVIINCPTKNEDSISAYKAIMNEVPVITTDVNCQSTYINKFIGDLVPIKTLNNNQDMKDYSKQFMKPLSHIIKNIDDYNKNIKQYYEEIIGEAENLENLIRNTTKVVSSSIMPTNIIYNHYMNEKLNEFNDLYLKYYSDNMGLVPREGVNNSKATKIKRKFRTFSLKNNIENEMHQVLGILIIVKAIINNIKDLITNLIKFIIKLFPTIKNLLIIIVKLFKKLLSIIKQLVIR